MKKINGALFAVLLTILLSGSGCIKQNVDRESQSESKTAVSPYTTINGKAEETLDGFYVNDYLLEDSEISKYKLGYKPEEYADKTLEIVGKVKNVNKVCEPFTQCREGSYDVITDIQSIKIIE